MPDENRVFDISKPGHGTPQATSKPIIVGHRPTMSDPMVGGEPRMETPAPTRISVMDGPAQDTAPAREVEPPTAGTPQSSWNGHIDSDTSASNEMVAPALGAIAAAEPEPAEPAPPETPEQTPSYSDVPPADDQAADAIPDPLPPIEHFGHVEGLHISPPPKKSKLPWILLILIVLLAGAYLLVDSGLVKTSVDLPFHVFKQKAAPAPTASQPKTAPAAAVPAGFTVYKIEKTPINFAAPTAWGEPSSTTDPGYTSRSEGAKSDGAHAYIIDFAVNKDVQVAVTSAKYLPAARAVQYYDFLQWCTGTSDNKIYLGVLQFTTTDKVEKASTVSCNQGPITDADKLNTTTIVELNSKSTDGTVFGDLYTKNLTDNEFTVLRVKDKAMKSGTQIKLLLNTVKITAVSAPASSAQ